MDWNGLRLVEPYERIYSTPYEDPWIRSNRVQVDRVRR
jgi:hypothetical protein